MTGLDGLLRGLLSRPRYEVIPAKATEQAIDATAVEVERISEAQRFTTKLLVDRGHQAINAETPRKVVTPH